MELIDSKAANHVYSSFTNGLQSSRQKHSFTEYLMYECQEEVYNKISGNNQDEVKKEVSL